MAPRATAAAEPLLDLQPEDARARLRHALRDLAEAGRLWRLCWTLGWLDVKLRYRGSVLGPFWLTASTAVMVAAMSLSTPPCSGPTLAPTCRSCRCRWCCGASSAAW